jgi:hypothetical protein
LPDDYEVAAFSESGLRHLPENDKQDLQTKIIKPLMTKVPKIIGDQVFAYSVSYSDEDINTSAWLLVFYKRVAFLCITHPKKIQRKHDV